MKIAVRYQSRGGNNKLVAETIGKAVGVEAKPVTAELTEAVDVLFLGGAVYGMQTDASLQQFLDQLDAQKVKAVVPFACVGLVKTPIKRIRQAAKAKGIKVLPEAPVIRLGFSHEAKPSAEKLREIAAYARSVTEGASTNG